MTENIIVLMVVFLPLIAIGIYSYKNWNLPRNGDENSVNGEISELNSSGNANGAEYLGALAVGAAAAAAMAAEPFFDDDETSSVNDDNFSDDNIFIDQDEMVAMEDDLNDDDLFEDEVAGTGSVADLDDPYGPVNPATGLPMIENTGIDVGGNPFGTDLDESSSFSSDSFSDDFFS